MVLEEGETDYAGVPRARAEAARVLPARTDYVEVARVRAEVARVRAEVARVRAAKTDTWRLRKHTRRQRRGAGRGWCRNGLGCCA